MKQVIICARNELKNKDEKYKVKGAEVQILRQNEVAVQMKIIYLKGKTEARFALLRSWESVE